MKDQVKYFQEIFANSSLVQRPNAQSDRVSREDLDNFKKDLISKISPGLFEDSHSKPVEEELGTDTFLASAKK